MNGYETKELQKDHVRALLQARRAAEVNRGFARKAKAEAEASEDWRAFGEAAENEAKAEKDLAAIDEQLQAFGHKGVSPRKRAETRPSASSTAAKR